MGKSSSIGMILTILSVLTADDIADAVGDALNPLVIIEGELADDTACEK